MVRADKKQTLVNIDLILKKAQFINYNKVFNKWLNIPWIKVSILLKI